MHLPSFAIQVLGRFDRNISLRQGRVSGTLFLIVLLCAIAGWGPEDRWAWATAKMVFSTLVVGAVPGILLVLWFRPWARLSLSELAAMGIAISLGLVQLLTIVSVLAHISVAWLTPVLLALCAVGSACIWWRRREPEILVEREELGIGLLLAILAFHLYLQGSPFLSAEDQVHVSVIRRLMTVGHPGLDNIYYAPHVIYTYPFPGTHFFFALVSHAGGLDPLFVYHKMRFFLALAAILFVWLAARALYGDRGVSSLAALTAVVFTMSGAFAHVQGFYWAQLAPFSHAGDVAMNVELPALISLTFWFLGADTRRQRAFLFAGSLALILMVTMVHIREAVQFLVYVCCFSLAVLVVQRNPVMFARSAGLAVATACAIFAYGRWHRATVGHVYAFLTPHSDRLLAIARGMSLWDWVKAPVNDSYFLLGLDQMFHAWNPVILLLSPLVIFVYRRRALMVFVCASLLAYALIVRFPFLSVPYIYGSYSEILITPVRNSAFFIYLLVGAQLHVLAGWAASMRRPLGVALAGAAILVGLGGSWSLLGPFFEQHPDWFFLPLIGMLALAFVSTRAAGSLTGSAIVPVHSSSRLTTAVSVVLVAALAVWTSVPRVSPLRASLRRSPLVLAALVGKFECERRPRVVWADIPDGPKTELTVPNSAPACPPTYGLMQWVTKALPVDAVILNNALNSYSSSTFMPQQIPAWPVAGGGVVNYAYRTLFPIYTSFFNRALTRYGMQPFYNSAESLEERLEMLAALGVSHVLVDPMYYAELKLVLRQWPVYFHERFDDGQWAVYEVTGS